MAITKIMTGKNKGKYRVRIQKRMNGKVIPFPSKVYSTKAEARKGEAEMLLEFEQLYPLTQYGDLTQPLAVVLDQYVEEQWRLKRWSSRSTYRAWKHLVKVVAEFFGTKRAMDIKTHDIDVWVHDYVKTRAEKGIQVCEDSTPIWVNMVYGETRYLSDQYLTSLEEINKSSPVKSEF